ncbi:hypothetical protein TIFTF001_004731 [Ficus carica]|uniref:Uncharacterized protein n=1 Tax=Ficus carica TaxID=3494 RepID=A0AA88DDG8_FICCA|nr:hypothetical protein TIFTF001_004731 [Ficus carica]
MDAQPSKKTEIVNEQGEVETRVVKTVDYQCSAGQCQEKRDVQVTIKSHPSANSTTTVGDVLSSTAAAASAAVQSAKDALSGK